MGGATDERWKGVCGERGVWEGPDPCTTHVSVACDTSLGYLPYFVVDCLVEIEFGRDRRALGLGGWWGGAGPEAGGPDRGLRGEGSGWVQNHQGGHAPVEVSTIVSRL